MQEGLEGGEEQPERRRLSVAGEAPQPVGQLGRHDSGRRRAAQALPGGARPVGGQREQLRRRRELPAPELEQVVQQRPVEPPALPDREVGILDLQQRQGGAHPRRRRPIEDGELPHEDLERPGIGRDVMDGEHGAVLAGRQVQ